MATRTRTARDPEHSDGAIRGLVGILGKRGSGKSFLLAQLVRECRRIIAFDTVCQFTPAQLPGFALITQPGRLVKFLREHLRSDFRVVYRAEYHPELHFTHVAKLAGIVGDLVLAVDEVDYFGTAGACDEELDWLIRYGRHRRVAMCYTARRPAEIPRNLTAQSSEFRIFRLTEPRDIEYMSRLIGPAAERLPRLEQFSHLRYLDSGEASIVDRNGQAALSQSSENSATKFDSSRRRGVIAETSGRPLNSRRNK